MYRVLIYQFSWNESSFINLKFPAPLLEMIKFNYSMTFSLTH